MFDSVLALSPHTDDVELGAGGTIAKLVESGVDVTVFAFSAPGKDLNSEFEKSMEVLGVKNFKVLGFERRTFPSSRQEILQILYDYNQGNRPDLVLTPCKSDTHQDHETISEETVRAFKSSTILGYQIPWNNIDVREDCLVGLDERHVDTKVKALMNYKSQMDKGYFDEEYLRSFVRSKGVKIKKKYAEPFETIKLVLDGSSL